MDRKRGKRKMGWARKEREQKDLSEEDCLLELS